MHATRKHPRSDTSLTGLGNALFPATRGKILGLLFGRIDCDYSISELIDRVGAGSGAVQREVERLASSGLLSVQTVGRQKRYRANPESPIHDELRALIVRLRSPVDPIRAAMESAGDEVMLAILYGSVAKGTDTVGSDIDLLVVSDTLTLEQVFDLVSEPEHEVSRPINPTLYTSREFRQRRQQGNPFLRRVLAGKHVVLKEDLDESVQSL